MIVAGGREGGVGRKLIVSVIVVATLALSGGNARGADVPLDLEQGLSLNYTRPIGVVNLYWDASWVPSQMDRIDAGTRAALASDYASNLRQYGVPGFVWRGRGTLIGSCGAAPATVDQETIAKFVRCEEATGGVPAAGGDFSGPTMIYNVIVPYNTTVKMTLGPATVGVSCPVLPTPDSFDAFHLFTPSGFRLAPFLPPGRPLVFTVIPARCAERAGYLPLITDELVEAATDPVPVPVPLFWINDTGVLGGRLNLREVLRKGEAVDICSALYGGDDLQGHAQAHFHRVPYAGTEVAAYWSNADDACVVGPWRVVWTEFSASNANPLFLKLDGRGDPFGLPHWQVMLRNTEYEYVAPSDLGAGRRYRFVGDCAGTVTFPGTTDAAAARAFQCGGIPQSEVRFEATGLPAGTPWQVVVAGVTYSGPPAPTWVDDGGPALEFSFGAVPNCTLTGTSAQSPLIVTGPVTVTGNYDCGPPPPPPCPTYPDAVRSTNPTAYWRLGDSDSTARDSGPFGLNGAYEAGVVEGVPGAIAGDADTAAAFSGSGIVVPNSFALDIVGAAVTIETWAKGGPQTPYAYLVSKSDFHGTLGYSMYAGQNATLRFFWGNGFSRLTDEAGFGWDGNWHHLVGVYDGSSNKLYVDGVLRANTPASGDIASSFGLPLTIGRWQGGGFTFSGAIDEVAVYDHALTPEQIQLHYAAATGAC